MENSIILDYINAANFIKDYELHSKNVFRKIVAYKKRKDLIKTLEDIYNEDTDKCIVCTKDTILEFVQMCNGTADYISVDGLSTFINVKTKVHLIKISREEDMPIFISTSNKPNSNFIFITYSDKKSFTKKIECEDRLKTDNSNASIVKHVNEMLCLYIKLYLKEYITQ